MSELERSGMTSTAAGTAKRPRWRFGLALAFGAAVALSLGIYGREHDPTGRSLVTLFFTQTITLKVWFATVAVLLALFQGVTALRIYGRLGKHTGPRWLRPAHRISGTAAFLFTIPVAYHCLWGLGYQWHPGTRGLVHGTLGCFFFGALAAKVLVVRSKRMPGSALPMLGGAVFSA